MFRVDILKAWGVGAIVEGLLSPLSPFTYFVLCLLPSTLIVTGAHLYRIKDMMMMTEGQVVRENEALSFVDGKNLQIFRQNYLNPLTWLEERKKHNLLNHLREQ